MKSLEKYILVVVMVLVAAGFAYMAYSFPDVETLTGVSQSGPKVNPPPTVKLEDLKGQFSTWGGSVVWIQPASKHDLFVSEPYLFFPSLYPSGAYVQLLGPDTKDQYGILVSWYTQHGLDVGDPNVAHEDADDDGFSNYIENLAGTDPKDANSHPSYLSRFRVKDSQQLPFHIKFESYVMISGKYLFNLSLSDVASEDQPPLKRTGDPLGTAPGEEGYVVGEFKKIIGTEMMSGHPVSVDKSTLELTKPDIGFKITLILQQEMMAPEVTGVFNLLMPKERGQDIAVPVGKTFTLSSEPTVTYTLISVNQDASGTLLSATIREESSKKMIEVPKLKDGEWDWVPAGGGPTGNTTQ